MNDFLTTITKTTAISPKARRQALLPLASHTELARAVNLLAHSKDISLRRAIVRAFADLSSDQNCRKILLHQFSLRPQLAELLYRDDDAKLRKNFFELLGRLDADLYADLLIRAYQEEKIEFVKPSILLALGNAKQNKDAQAFLQSIPSAFDPSDKHQLAQSQALCKARDSLMPRAFISLPDKPMSKPTEVIFFCPNARVTLDELQSIGLDAKTYSAKDGLCIAHSVKNFYSLYHARTFYEAGILLYESDSLRHAIKGMNKSVVCRNVLNLYQRTDLCYRIDVTGRTITQKERLEAYEQIHQALLDTPLHNSPSSYDFELRISCIGKTFIACLIPGSQNDTRFSYRKQAISASMHPAVAASCCRVIAHYAKKEDSVLDCFCGAGTFLLERARYPHRDLFGSDISASAIKVAKNNASCAKIKAEFFVKNAITPFSHKYDEVIGNLPFGLRVSNHIANQKLYADFFKNLQLTLKPNGHAFLFTNEKKLMQETILPNFCLKGKINFAAGGLFPSLYILQISNPKSN